MRKFYILFIILFIQCNSQTKENPKFLTESLYPFVLSTNDNYYYVIALGEQMKIKKDSGNIEETGNNGAERQDYIFVADNSYNNWVYIAKKYYEIIYDPFLSYKEVILEENSVFHYLETTGCITKYNGEIILYGYYQNDDLVFSKTSGHFAILKLNNIKNNKLICTFIQNDDYTCGLITDNRLTIYCLKFHTESINSQENTLEIYTNKEDNI